jgi:outer membrane receptor protein involved in Fe transport
MRFLGLSLLIISTAFCQTASVTGRVTDPTGAVVPQASVAVQATESGVSTTVQTNDQGYYNFPSLLPGTYNLTVTKTGFKPLREAQLKLTVQQVARIDLVLEVGAVTETVDVNAQAVLLDSESSTVGQLVGNKQVAELPLLGRNPYALAMLVPGVRQSIGVNNLPIDQISTVSITINGQRASANEFLLDGAPNSAPSQNQPVIYANPDSVQEFKVDTNTFSAEYGRAAGGVFNVITKSGTNDPHFTLYEFFRNDQLNANDFFANKGGSARPPFKFNQFGGSIGGPVVIPKVYNGKNKTFLFGNFELVRFVQGITFTGTEPTAQQLTGDFSQTRNAAGAVIQIYDPLSTTAAAGGGFTRTAFPGNIIPANRINPASALISKYFPAPNTAGNLITNVNNYSRTAGNDVTKNTMSIRGDHYFSERNRLFSRFSYDDTPFVRAAPYGASNPGSPGTGPQDFNRKNAVIEDDHTFSPSMLGTFRYSITRLTNVRTAFSQGFDITSLGFPASLKQQVFPPAFPDIAITGYNVTSSIPNIVVGGALGATDVIQLANDTHTWSAQITKTLTRHTLKTGFEYRLIKFNTLQTGANTPGFNFTNAFTQGPNPNTASATAGYALASFLLGTDASGSVNPAPSLAMQITYYGGFLQDDWKVTPRLTLNLGLRYEYESPRTERYNQLDTFDYNAASPLQAPGLNLKGALTFVGVNGASRFQGTPDRNNVGPRVGFAYRLDTNTVLRGGGGLFYASTQGVGTGSAGFGSTGFTVQSNQVSTIDGVTPATFLNNPFPGGLSQPSGSKLGPATALGQSITFSDLGDVVPYSEQWNFNIQRILPGAVLLEVGYAGSHGLKLPTNLTLNQLPDSALAMGNALQAQVPNPFYGQISTGILSTPTISRAQLLRPFPQYDGVTAVNSTWANSIYHSLQIKVEKRYSKGLTITGSYTRSKLIDYDIGAFAGETLGGGNIQDYQNLRSSRSVSLVDQPNRFIANAVYELPFGKSLHGIAGKVVAGWEVGAILSLFSGGPIGVTSATNNTFSQGGNQHPNWTGVDPSVPNPTPDHWIDASQFSNPPAFAFGNAGRTIPSLRDAATKELDFSLHKSVNLTEKLRLQCRTEVFNITNTPQFAPPNSVFGNAQFGVVSAQSNLPRIVQFALKLIF